MEKKIKDAEPRKYDVGNYVYVYLNDMPVYCVVTCVCRNGYSLVASETGECLIASESVMFTTLEECMDDAYRRKFDEYIALTLQYASPETIIATLIRKNLKKEALSAVELDILSEQTMALFERDLVNEDGTECIMSDTSAVDMDFIPIDLVEQKA